MKQRTPYCDLKIHDLRIFDHVAKGNTHTETGGEFGMTQAGVTLAIARIERQFKVRLFMKNGRSKALTTKGLEVQKTVVSILKSIDTVSINRRTRQGDHHDKNEK